MESLTHHQPQEIWMVGVIGRTVMPVLHNCIASHLNLPWTFSKKHFDNLDDIIRHLRSPLCAGAVATMPWKTTIAAHLDEIDDSGRILAACNTISSRLDPSTGKKRLIGYNTDWIGVVGAIKQALPRDRPLPTTATGAIVGAGGAARAAVYALWKDLHCTRIYVLNRDADEVVALQNDVDTNYASLPSPGPQLVHVTSVAQATELPSPQYVVGTVPDFEPATPEEVAVKQTLRAVLRQAPSKGVLVDMCYRPRRTRHIVMAEEEGWRTVQGWYVAAHQVQSQWDAFIGQSAVERLKGFEAEYWAVAEEEVETYP